MQSNKKSVAELKMIEGRNKEIQVILDDKIEVGKSNRVKDYRLQPCEFVCEITLLKFF